MIEQLKQVAEFNEIGGQIIQKNFNHTDILTLKLGLIKEEIKELQDACLANDRVEVLDALADILYVVYGFAWAYGFDKVLPEAFDRVHKSNMSKFPTSAKEADDTILKYIQEGVPTEYTRVEDIYTILRKEDGKILKSINYKPVDLTDLV